MSSSDNESENDDVGSVGGDDLPEEYYDGMEDDWFYGLLEGIKISDIYSLKAILAVEGGNEPMYDVYRDLFTREITIYDRYFDDDSKNIFQVFEYCVRKGGHIQESAQKRLCIEIARLIFQINGNENDERCERLEELEQRYENYLEYQLQV